MDYQRFISQLPELYENWGQSSVHPKSEQFQAALSQVQGMTTANVLQLLNWAVSCMEPDEIYCEVGCFQGATLIGALLNHPEEMAYAVDNFSEFDDSGENIEQLSNNLALFNLDEQVIFCNQDFEEFLGELREIEPAVKIGVYFYDGAHDYRSQLLGLMLARPFLAEKALIVVDDANWSSVKQANWDFMAAHPECELMLDLPTPADGHHTFWNGLHIFSWDVNRNDSYSWLTMVENYREPQYIKAIYELHFDFEFNRKRRAIEVLEKEALALEESNHLLEAEQKYKQIIEWDRNNASAYHNLGKIYYEKARYQEAIDMLLRCLSLDSSKDVDHFTLGVVLHEVGDVIKAMSEYEKAIAINPQFRDAYNNLGNILCTVGEMERAKSIYRQAIAVDPNHFGSYLNLGNLLVAQHQMDEAIACYEKAIQVSPQNHEVIQNLKLASEIKHDDGKAARYFGDTAYKQHKYEEAIEHYQKFLSNHTGDIKFYLDFAKCYKNLNRHEEAIKAYQTGLRHYPRSGELYLGVVATLEEFGRTREAIAVASEALQLLPNHVALKLENTRLLPIIYETEEEIDFYRDRFTKQLENFIQQTTLDSQENIDSAFRAIGGMTNFYLQYQCKNDLELQSLYGQFVNKVTTAKYPEWTKPLTMPPVGDGEKIRVGYVSAYFRQHTVGKLTMGWLKNHNREKLRIYCYYIGEEKDYKTQQFRLYSDVFHHIPNNLEAICQQIVADNLHVLVYPDIGMFAQLTQMAGLRLAPVQCMGWGHPITSGLPTIDYYLSSELMEPENAKQHYLEELICLPNLGISYAKPVIPESRKSRSCFNLRDDAVVYLSCQSLLKYLPQYDYIFAEIARHVSSAQFAFIGYQTTEGITGKFQQRLKKAFAKVGLNSEEYCTIVPRVNYPDYLHLNKVSDIYLDTLGWSGGNTTLEAIACNLPVCTMPGEFMRGRHSYGILKMLGVTETIAKNEAEYIEIAARLGLDKEWRQSIVEKIRKNQDRLYEDKTCVSALEAFYDRVVQQGR